MIRQAQSAWFIQTNEPEKRVVPIWFLLVNVLQQSRASKILKTKHLDPFVSFKVPAFWWLDTQMCKI